jgi:hypothetical protein
MRHTQGGMAMDSRADVPAAKGPVKNFKVLFDES